MNPATPPDPAPLTGEERAVLAAIAAHEHRWDAGFANALAVGTPPGPAHRWRTVLLVLAVVVPVVVAPLVLSSAWVLAIVAVLLLVVIPTTLVVWALRQEGGLRPREY
jgi:antibiotic biosynthesis monooxygenase (ABM) superfamily enzyme